MFPEGDIRNKLTPAERLYTGIVSRISKDLVFMDKAFEQSPILIGNLLYGRYLLSDGKTRVGIHSLPAQSNEDLLRADQILHGSDKYRVYEAVKLLDLNPQFISVPDPKGLIDIDLYQKVAQIFFRQTKVVSMFEDIFLGSARKPNVLRNEVWNVFKVVKDGQVKIEILTDTSAVGFSSMNEPGTFAVPSQKVDKLSGELMQAKLIDFDITFRNQQEKDTLSLWNALHTELSR